MYIMFYCGFFSSSVSFHIERIVPLECVPVVTGRWCNTATGARIVDLHIETTKEEKTAKCLLLVYRSDKKRSFLLFFCFLMMLCRIFFVTLPPNLTITMKPSDFIHPEDAAALRQMEDIPGFAALVKKVLAIGVENLQSGINMAFSIRLSEKQLPKRDKHLLQICLRLGIPEPGFYMQVNPVPNAWTSGDIFISWSPLVWWK